MKKPSAAQKKLQAIADQANLDELDHFHDRRSWGSLDDKDRELLASLFLRRAHKILNSDNDLVEECFRRAVELMPDSAEIYYQIGVIYAMITNDNIILKKAEEAYLMALQLQSDHINALYKLDQVRRHMTHNSGEPDALHEQYEFYKKFETAAALTKTQRADLCARWSQVAALIAAYSGEASDYCLAVEIARKAAELGHNEADFWIHFGDVTAELSTLLNREDLLMEAIELFRKGLRLGFDSFTGWYFLGASYQKLFEMTLAEEYYTQASECYQMAGQIQDDSSRLWCKWAMLGTLYAKVHHDIAILEDSLNKFDRAAVLEPDNSDILMNRGEALLLYGTVKENIEYISKAQKSIAASLELQPNSIEGWYLFGNSYIEFGRYFHQEDYYHQAIEKFQCGLNLQQNSGMLWYGMALAYYHIGEIRGDLSWIDKSTKLYAQVLEFQTGEFKPLWHDWGIAYMKMGEITGEPEYFDQALEKFEHLVPANPDEWDINVLDPEWLYSYGCAQDFLGDCNNDAEAYEKAILSLQRVLVLDPQHAHARYSLALALSHFAELTSDLECFHKSIEQFQILLNHDQEDDLGWNEYGMTLLHLAELINEPTRHEQVQKLFQLAEVKFTNALSLGNYQAHYNLALLYSLMGNYDASLYQLHRANQEFVLPSVDMLLQDEWLAGVRGTEAFRHFIETLEKGS